jgi:acetolactate synthase-1/2/3 large subunit
MGELYRLTGGDCILTTEVGQHQMWAAQFFNFRYPRRFLTSGGLGTMGYGLGAAIGAQVGCPDLPVINIAGDGSFHMNANELSTLAHYNIPVIELVFNNQVLGMVRQWQKLFYGRRFSHTDIQQTTDFKKLGEAYGVRSFTIEKVSEIGPVLQEALAYKGPSLINCVIDKDLNVLPMVKAGAPVSEPMLTME